MLVDVDVANGTYAYVPAESFHGTLRRRRDRVDPAGDHAAIGLALVVRNDLLAGSP